MGLDEKAPPMNKPPRKWTLCYDSNFDDHPPVVIKGPQISGYEMEVDVIEMSVYQQLKDENEKLVYKLECLLCHASGSMASKASYDIETMYEAVNDHIQREVDSATKDIDLKKRWSR